MADTHEVYPSAPLALVAVEVRFPGADSTMTMTVQRSFRDLLGEDWVLEPLKTQSLAVSFGPGGAAQQASQVVTVPRFTVRDRTTAIALSEGSLTVQTTRYRNYPDFREVVLRALMAAFEVLHPEGVARVGMRYIDELRVAQIREEDPAGWKQWLDASLLSPGLEAMASDGYRAEGWDGAVQYETGPNRKLVLRYGPRTGYAVDPVGPLKRADAPPPGPLFALDFDCFWEPPDIPEFEPAALIRTCDELRAPIRKLFDLLMTEALLSEFRRERSDG